MLANDNAAGDEAETTGYNGKIIKLVCNLDLKNDKSYVDPNTTQFGDLFQTSQGILLSYNSKDEQKVELLAAGQSQGLKKDLETAFTYIARR